MKGLNIPKYNLEGVQGEICTIRKSNILPFMTTVVKGIVNLVTHSKCMSLVVEPATGYLDHIATARSYGVLKPGRGKIDVHLRNHSTKQITLPKQTAMGEITAPNGILGLLALKPTGDESGKGKLPFGKGKVRVKKNCWTKFT